MTTTEHKLIICNLYCKHRGNKGTCVHCSLNPILNNNFELSDTARDLIRINILHCGSRMVSEFVDEFGKELCGKLSTMVKVNG